MIGWEFALTYSLQPWLLCMRSWWQERNIVVLQHSSRYTEVQQGPRKIWQSRMFSSRTDPCIVGLKTVK